MIYFSCANLSDQEWKSKPPSEVSFTTLYVAGGGYMGKTNDKPKGEVGAYSQVELPESYLSMTYERSHC
jgi:hypothetical protein